MPKELTHWILAGRTLVRLPDTPLARLLRAHQAAYLAGAVLPDTLMHLLTGRWSRPALALADHFHNPEGNSYAPLVRAELLHGAPLPPPLLACLLGVLSHMRSDIHLHPFVHAHSATMGDHYRLETAIDLHFLRSDRPPARRLADLLDPSTRRTMTTACSLLFDPRQTLPTGAMERAVEMHARLQALYATPFWQLIAAALGRLRVGRLAHQRHLFYPLSAEREKIPLPGGPWTDPTTGERDERDIDELAETAVKTTVELFGRIDEAGFALGTALEGIQGENLLTGRHGVRKVR